MATEIKMPQLGESVVDGTVGEWLKQVGDIVEEFEPIVRVSTDKVDTEIPAPAEGVLLEIYIQEGETVDAGIPLGVIGKANEDVQLTRETAVKATANGTHTPVSAPPSRATSSTPSTGGYTGHVTPVVARMAQEHDLDLSQIEGTGRNGRIRKKDVLAYLEQRENGNGNTASTAEPELAPWEIPGSGDLFKPSVNYEDPPATQRKQATKAQPATPVQPVVAQAKSAPVPQGIPGELVQLSNMRRSIAKHMVESKLQTAP
ncbi:MAG: biotin/lipoyl-containing protein, partial [Chloroflexota bacterium]